MLFFHSDAVPMYFVVTDILPWVGKCPEDQSRRSYQAFQLCPEAKTWDDLYSLQLLMIIIIFLLPGMPIVPRSKDLEGVLNYFEAKTCGQAYMNTSN